MKQNKNIVAFDCGNSSYRLVLGRYDQNTIAMETIAQETNEMVKVKEYYYWDILKIYQFLINNLKKVVQTVGQIDSIGISTWGVDFALFDNQGHMLSNPLSYRNEIGAVHLNKIDKTEHENLFLKTGILSNRINSVYMISALKQLMPEIYSITDKILMMPDIINYLLTGVMIHEPSELSTTQLYNVLTKQIDLEVCDKFNISHERFSQIGVHGQKIGNLLPSIKEELNIDYDIPVICVPSHDTAAAVAAIPAQEDEFVFISSGTWALIGAELDQPIINRKTLDYSFTNEMGAYDKITFLKNSVGMFILEKIKNEYEFATNKLSDWKEIIDLASSISEFYLINVNDARFFNPQNMTKEIQDYLKETGQYADDLNWGIVLKTVMVSMACNYSVTVQELESVIGKEFDTIYIVGGGSQNQIINQLTSKYTGKKLIIGSKESTCLGNIGSQITYFNPKDTLPKIRHVIKKSITLQEFKSEETDNKILDQYRELVLNFRGIQ